MRELFTLFLLLSFQSAQAQSVFQHYQQLHSPDSSAGAFLYIKKDFGSYSNKHDTSLKLGLTVDYEYQALSQTRNHFSLNPLPYRHTFMELEYSTGKQELSRFKLGAMDSSTYEFILKQNDENDDESSGWPTEVWVTIGIVLTVAVIVAVASGDCSNAPDFQPRTCPAE